MPIPQPRPNESEDAFVIRCMLDSTMELEYPEHQQRFAICLNEYERNDREGESVNNLEQRTNNDAESEKHRKA